MAARATILSLAAGVVLQAHLAACFSTVALPSAARARSHAAASASTAAAAAATAAAPAPASPASQPVGAHTRWTSRAAHCSHGVAPMAAATRSSTASLLRLQAVEEPTAAEREPDAIDLDIETQARYDGGDCCRCTCISNDGSACGSGTEFECRDPTPPCVDDDDSSTSGYTSTLKCLTICFGDGDCDLENNEEDCGYDGGDCCEYTCVSTEAFTCGDETQGGYYCLDPSASCVDDDDNTARPTNYDSRDDDSVSVPDTYSSSDTEESTSLCSGDSISDGTCDADNNNEECGYDGGDCCECTCVFTSDFTCVEGRYDCVDPSAPCINGYVQASTKTTIFVSANAYDTRPGQNSDMVGCQEEGCAPALSRDSASTDIESRWSCAQKIVRDGDFCEIEFTFEDPQDIVEVQVAFWKGDERSRTLEVPTLDAAGNCCYPTTAGCCIGHIEGFKAEINGEVIGAFDSYPGTTFNALGIQRVGVETMTFRTVRLPEND